MVCCRRAKNGYTNYDASSTITPLATKTKRSICTRSTSTKVFDKLSRAAFAKHKSYKWWNNIFGPSHQILFIQYPEDHFSLQNTLCLLWNKSLFFVFRNIHYIGFTGKNSFKLKISVNVLNFQNSTLGLKFGYISYQMPFKKSMIGLKWTSPCL